MNRWNTVISTFPFAASVDPTHVRISGPEAFREFREAKVAAYVDGKGREIPAEKDDRTKDGPLWSAAVYHKGKKRERNKTAQNVAFVTFMVFDFDPKQGWSIEQVKAALEDIGWEHVIYTTFSHGPTTHAFRVVIPLSREITVPEHELLWESAFGVLKQRGVPPDHLADPGRMFYLPTKRVGLPGNPDDHWHFSYAELDGPFEVDLRLKRLAQQGKVPGPAPSPRSAPVGAGATADGSNPLLERLKAEAAARGLGEAKLDDDLAEAIEGIEHADETENYEKIKAGCAFMAYAEESAKDLSEPEWYAQLSIAARCKGGHQLVHTLSEPYVGYDPGETTDKAKRALTDTGPFTCEKISTLSKEAEERCKACPHFGVLTSPIQLGKPDLKTATAEEVREDALTRLKAQIAKAKAEVSAARKEHTEALIAVGKLKATKRFMASVEEQVAAMEEAKVKVQETRERKNQAEKALKVLERDLSQFDATEKAGGNEAVRMRMKSNPVSKRPEAIAFNVAVALRNDERYKEKVWFNEFSGRVHYGDDINSRAAEDDQDSEVLVDLQNRYDLYCKITDVRMMAYMVARNKRRHPVREYLRDQIRWDGVSRIPELMRKGFGAVVDDVQTEAYLVEAARKFMVSAVARVLEPRVRNGVVEGGPGCKVDTMLVLVGKQGKFKSTCLRFLAGRGWFADTRIDLMNKDAYMQIHGVWIYEIGELDSFKKADTTRIRAFLSSQDDTYRPPFGHHVIKVPRQTILVGTTNEDEFIDDPAGTRRFVPVRVGECDPDWIRENVDQLWAEAVALYDQGEIWWFDGDSEERLLAQGEQHRDEDPWAQYIAGWLANSQKREFTIFEILSAMLLTPDKMTKAHKNRIANALRMMGIPSARADKGDPRGRVRLYRLPPDMIFGTGVPSVTVQEINEIVDENKGKK